MTLPSLEPIGVIRTARVAFDETPVQAALNVGEEGTIELDPRYADATDGLAEFSHAWLLTWLGPTDGSPVPSPGLRQVPFLLQGSGRELGIFAMRGPRRPNPIGLSLVRIVDVEPVRITFGGVDMIDGTPLLDLKPYFRDADVPSGPVRCGWFDAVDLSGPLTPGELRRGSGAGPN